MTVSVIAFAVADDIARSALSVWIPLLVAVFVLPFPALSRRQTLGNLKRLSVANEAVGRARTRLLNQSIVFAVLFMIIASTIGYFIGISGNETQHLFADLNDTREIAKRIGRAAQFCREPSCRTNRHVRQTGAGCAGLLDNLLGPAQRVGRIRRKVSRPTQQHGDDLTRSGREANRADLLLQEIKVARRMEYLDVVQQWTAWDSDMKPLLGPGGRAQLGG